ncbi:MULTISPECIES: histidine kinase N-terminal 7TM domain-containing diguanylate cyclase [Bacillus]|uniref:histidine kinase N-terminal 7TM domain-containing diguanylate cyclase n=1 Tax=Bacillus TaxID=1386 RepID=UPI000D3851B2|nr:MULTISPECIES: histidine kinase N-terminal 7TM domain-containing protein [Bacillus]MBU4618151.1 diguanylate cyclase [Bacillus sp. GG161]MDC7798046.1 histidine kinase N-terminal 7TM domain-containing protein [Bacillus altitudinis]PUF91670.1 diguanylate cyclase [Bacillus altitudinis]PWN84461.1 GGDEF domain-containing protein [Bacillus altitudinis]WHX71024.1 histidine kinase N-terminal 7TM domain-containing protein [Bacillus altitudinis]
MDSIVLHFIVIMSVSGILSVILSIIAHANRHRYIGCQLFMYMSGATAIYIFGHTFELLARTPQEITFWVSFQYIGLPFIAPFSLMIVLQFTGFHQYVTKRRVLLFLLIPILTTILVFTNSFHSLFYRSITMNTVDGFLLADFTIGYWYIIHGVYTFGCSMLAIFMLLWFLRVKREYLKQVLILLVGILLPITTSFIYLLGVTPFHIDPVPVVMFLTNALYLWAIMSFHLFKLSPIAMERVFEHMSEGVLLLDRYRTLIDYNPAAALIIPVLAKKGIGYKIDDIFSGIIKEPAFIQWLRSPQDHSQYDLMWEKEQPFYYHLTASSLFNRRGEVEGRQIVISDVTEQRLLQEELERRAYIDGLTNIFNRSSFIERTQMLLEEDAQDTAILLFDIDFFKQINDTHGHHIGDEALRHVVSICQQHLKMDDLFGRYGGEEFAICLPHHSFEEACHIAEQMRHSFEVSFFQTDEKKVRVTASFGVAHTANDPSILETLLFEADQALYMSKRQGRNRIYASTGSGYMLYQKQDLPPASH